MYGRTGLGLTDRERYLFFECCEALEPFGKSLRDATAFFVDHLKATQKSCTAAELVKELVAAKKTDLASQRHIDDLESRLNMFAGHFNSRAVATITCAEIDDWLRALPVGPVTRNHYRRLGSLAFNFAKDRGYAVNNPARESTEVREPKTKPGILTVEQANALLINAAPEILLYLAIGMFAGLRRSELVQIKWSDVDFDEGLIEVPAEESKSKNANRFIVMQPNLRAWLLPFRKLGGHIAPRENFRQFFDQARIAAGFKDHQGRLADWPDNALRHSFASYHYAHFKDAKGLASEMGHASTKMIFEDYRRTVKPSLAARFWAILPKSNVCDASDRH